LSARATTPTETLLPKRRPLSMKACLSA